MNVKFTNTIAGACWVAVAVATQGYWLREIEAFPGSRLSLVGLLAVFASAAFFVFSNSTLARSTIA